METLELIKDHIEKCRFIRIRELITLTANKLIESISTKDLMTMKEHPNNENIRRMVELYEEKSKELIELIVVLIREGDISNHSQYQETIKEVFDNLITSGKPNTEGYGYIWRHLSNYPILLLSYSTNMMLLKKRNYKFLNELMNIPYKQRYMGMDFMQTLDISLPEAINCYHLFNDIDYINVDIYQYLLDDDKNITDIQKRLVVNNRVYNYLSGFLTKYYTNGNDFSDYFDLYEYFLGLFFMDKRLSIDDNPPNRETGAFAPYGRRFRVYSESGRYFNFKDSIVHKFLQNMKDTNNDIINSGFFNGEKEKFELAYSYYKDLLGRI